MKKIIKKMEVLKTALTLAVEIATKFRELGYQILYILIVYPMIVVLFISFFGFKVGFALT